MHSSKGSVSLIVAKTTRIHVRASSSTPRGTWTRHRLEEMRGICKHRWLCVRLYDIIERCMGCRMYVNGRRTGSPCVFGRVRDVLREQRSRGLCNHSVITKAHKPSASGIRETNQPRRERRTHPMVSSLPRRGTTLSRNGDPPLRIRLCTMQQYSTAPIPYPMSTYSTTCRML